MGQAVILNVFCTIGSPNCKVASHKIKKHLVLGHGVYVMATTKSSYAEPYLNIKESRMSEDELTSVLGMDLTPYYTLYNRLERAFSDFYAGTTTYFGH